MATTKESILQENRSVQEHKSKKDMEPAVHSRKTLQTLQVSAVNNLTLVGKDTTVSLKNDNKKNSNLKKINPRTKALSVYEDPAEQIRRRSFDDKAVQTEKERQQRLSEAGDDLDPEVFELMVQEEVPESYWKEIAEQRRVALNDSLHENEMLHKEIEELREENSKLNVMASKADYFADVIQSMLGDEGEETEEKIKTEEDSGIQSTEMSGETDDDKVVNDTGSSDSDVFGSERCDVKNSQEGEDTRLKENDKDLKPKGMEPSKDEKEEQKEESGEENEVSNTDRDAKGLISSSSQKEK